MLRFIEVGHIQKPHGLKGEVRAAFYYSFTKKKLNSIFIGASNPLPCFIEHIQMAGKGNFLLKIQDCNDRTQAEEICGEKIHVRTDDFEKYFEPSEAAGLIGYKVFAEGRLLGTIEDVFRLPQQFLAQVFAGGKEILIPLNEETIVNADRRRKILTLQLPDGLLDV
ncbi:MAG TPA: ribosome maturation factor RimM [Chitinophagales bacterium]|nr:ribosome maturation factor RimM [Chitinophagales bacterium]